MATFPGTNGSDIINGTPANDSIFGRAGSDILNSGAGDDTLNGGNGNNILNSGVGNDILDSGAGNDILNGDNGNDILNSGAGKDILNGGAGRDILNSGAGNDILNGGAGRDILTGGQGSDILAGGSGSDRLTGGAGADRFGFARPNEGIDIITDFVVADDRIDVSATGFRGGLTAGAVIKPGQFTYGKVAGDASDRFVYDRGTGALYFDVDGTGAAQQVQIATLANKPLITNTDIFVSPQDSITQTNISTQINTNAVDVFQGVITQINDIF